MNAITVYVLSDDRGGFTAVFRDVFSEAHRTEKFATAAKAKFEMVRWLSETFGKYPRVDWHSRSESDYNACHAPKVTIVAPTVTIV